MDLAASGRRGNTGALSGDQAVELRDALLAACNVVHADAAAVLARSPDASSSLPLAWLRTSPSTDGGDLESHVAVALFWGLFREERRREKQQRQREQKEEEEKKKEEEEQTAAAAKAGQGTFN